MGAAERGATPGASSLRGEALPGSGGAGHRAPGRATGRMRCWVPWLASSEDGHSVLSEIGSEATGSEGGRLRSGKAS